MPGAGVSVKRIQFDSMTAQESLMTGEKRTTKYAKGAKRGAKLPFKDESDRGFKNEHRAVSQSVRRFGKRSIFIDM
jgi:hypothetical protein